MERRAFLSVLACGTAPLLSGCAGGGGEGDTATATPMSTPTPTAGTRSAQKAYPDYEWGRLEGADPVATSEVVMKDLEFTPLVAAVEPGTDVRFRNEDSATHTVSIPAIGVDQPVKGGGSTTVTFERKGTFDYVCERHPPSMLGRVVVTDDVATGTTQGGTESPTPTPTPTPGGKTTTTSDGGYY